MSHVAILLPTATDTPQTYVHDYDHIVAAIARRVGRANVPNLIGVGGCISGFWAWWLHGSCAEWIPYFLNRSHHVSEPSVPMDYVSKHAPHCARSTQRTAHAPSPRVPCALLTVVGASLGPQVSMHYYASSNNRSEPATYTAGFFGGVDAYARLMVRCQRSHSDTWHSPLQAPHSQ